jgi:hypothetical protein
MTLTSANVNAFSISFWNSCIARFIYDKHQLICFDSSKTYYYHSIVSCIYHFDWFCYCEQEVLLW